MYSLNMTISEAIITALRRYCADHYSYWLNEYSQKKTGSKNDNNLFPRYYALNAIRETIECFVGTEFPDIKTCKLTLKQAAQKAQDSFTKEVEDKTGRKAMQEERDKCCQFIDGLEQDTLTRIEPLPFRRRLNDEEREQILGKLKKNWDLDGYWVPVREVRSDLRVLFFSKEDLTQKDFQDFYEFINKKVKHRFFEISGEQVAYEIDPAGFVPDSYETVFCDREASWLIYGSYERTIAFGGKWLLDFLDEKFKDRKELINAWRKKADSGEWPSDEWKDWNTM
jgi:hypothetical protein